MTLRMIFPSPGLAATLSPSDGERDGVRGLALGSGQRGRSASNEVHLSNACSLFSTFFGPHTGLGAGIASHPGPTPPPCATTCSVKFNSICAGPVW